MSSVYVHNSINYINVYNACVVMYDLLLGLFNCMRYVSTCIGHLVCMYSLISSKYSYG